MVKAVVFRMLRVHMELLFSQIFKGTRVYLTHEMLLEGGGGGSELSV